MCGGMYGRCVHVCMYVCMCVYVWVCVCMYVCMCVYVCMYVCMYVFMYVCVYVWVYVCMYVHVCMSVLALMDGCVYCIIQQQAGLTIFHERLTKHSLSREVRLDFLVEEPYTGTTLQEDPRLRH